MMIEKLKEHDIIDPKTDKVIGKIGCDLREIMDKLNELCDAVNTIQTEREAERFEIQEWIGIIEAVRKSVNIHEKQIDELQMKAEPEKCEIPVDQYAEQHRWIGKICKFWNWDTGLAHYSKLITIKDINDGEMSNCPFRADDGGWYMYCEPVKPDDDIIYQGGNNE